MSSGGKNQTITQKNDPPAWALPYFKDAVGRAQDISEQPYTPYTGQLVAGQNGDQYVSQDMIRSMAYGPSVIGNGQDYAAGLLGGQGQYQGGSNPYIGAQNPLIRSISGGGGINAGTNKFAGDNPYVDQMIAASSRDVTDNFSNATMPSLMAQFQQGGAFGGTAMQNQMTSANNTLSQNLGELSNQYRFQDYQTQQAMDESRLARQAQLSDSAAARDMQASIAAAQLYGQDLSRNASLGEGALGRDLASWGQYQNNQISALGMLPSLNQSQYYGAGLLGQQGLQQQGLNQTWLDANYRQFLDARDWDVSRFQPYLQGISAMQGGSMSSTQPGANPAIGALGGALSGAAVAGMFGAGGGAAAGASAGATAGSAVPGWGTAIGAGIGGLMGYFGSR